MGSEREPGAEGPAPRLQKLGRPLIQFPGASGGQNATVIRVLFVVLAVLGGSGFLIYLAMWIIVPSSHETCRPSRVPVGYARCGSFVANWLTACRSWTMAHYVAGSGGFRAGKRRHHGGALHDSAARVCGAGGRHRAELGDADVGADGGGLGGPRGGVGAAGGRAGGGRPRGADAAGRQHRRADRGGRLGDRRRSRRTARSTAGPSPTTRRRSRSPAWTGRTRCR